MTKRQPDVRVRAGLWDGGFLGVGPGYGRIAVHAHHAHQISIALDGPPARFRSAEDEAWRPHQAALIGANRPHSFDGTGSIVAMIFIDPETFEGRWLERSRSGDIMAIPEERLRPLLPALAATMHGPFDPDGAVDAVEAVIRAVCRGPRPSATRDSRILRALEYLRAADAAKVSLAEVANAVFLSESRFAHLFRDEVGIPFRRYVLWRRLSRAMFAIGEGRTLTAAAYEAGFADSAHLTRTFQQMFGLAPSIMTGPVDFYEMPAPFTREKPPA